MAVFAKELSRPTILYQNATLIVSGNNVTSGFLRVPRRDVTVVKTHTTGTYTITLDWANDGVNTVFTEQPTMVNNVPQNFVCRAPFLKVTIAATVANFTVHQTNVML